MCGSAQPISSGSTGYKKHDTLALLSNCCKTDFRRETAANMTALSNPAGRMASCKYMQFQTCAKGTAELVLLAETIEVRLQCLFR